MADIPPLPNKAVLPTRVRIRRTKKDGIVTGCDVYIGRRFTQGGWDLPQSVFANPFKVKTKPSQTGAEYFTREEAIQRYYFYCLSNLEI